LDFVSGSSADFGFWNFGTKDRTWADLIGGLLGGIDFNRSWILRIIFYRLVAEDLLLPDLDFDGLGLSHEGLRLLYLVRVSELELSRTHHLNVLDLDPHH